MKTLKQNSYISITSDMVTNLKLSGNNLIVYALIHGYTKDGENKRFTGSLELIQTWTNMSKSSVIATLKFLVNNNFIYKYEEWKNGVKFCEYWHNDELLLGSMESTPVVKKYEKKVVRNQYEGGMESEPNIISYPISNNKKDISNDISQKKHSSDDDAIERLYSCYPSKCPHRGVTLKSGKKDRKLIAKALKEHTEDELTLMLKIYLQECSAAKTYLKAQATFYNNLPDYDDIKTTTAEEPEEKKAGSKWQ